MSKSWYVGKSPRTEKLCKKSNPSVVLHQIFGDFCTEGLSIESTTFYGTYFYSAPKTKVYSAQIHVEVCKNSIISQPNTGQDALHVCNDRTFYF